MDYTTLAQVKSEMKIDQTTQDVLLASLITSASRALDRRCTGQNDFSADNYFMLEDKANEIIYGQINIRGEVTCVPRKPVVNSVAAFSFQENITTQVYTVEPTRCDIVGNKVIAFPRTMPLELFRRVRVTISYNGGYSGSTSGLPADFQELCTLLVARFYREAETGLSDAIGVPEIGQLVYTKAWPSRLVDQLETYIRRQGWSYPA